MPAPWPPEPQKEAGADVVARWFREPNSGPSFFTCLVLTLLNHGALERTALYSLQNLLPVPSPGLICPLNWAEAKSKPLPAAIFPGSM